MGLPELVARLERDAEARVTEIHARAQADVAALEAERQRFALRAREEALAARRSERRARLAREIARARRGARLDELCAQHGVIDRVMARTGELLEAMDQDDAYLAALHRQVEDALRYVEDRAAVVRCRPSLAAVVRAVVAGREGTTCEEVAGMPVGFTIRTGDGALEIDDTLAARLARLRRRLSVDLIGRVVR